MSEVFCCAEFLRLMVWFPQYFSQQEKLTRFSNEYKECLMKAVGFDKVSKAAG